MPRRSKVMALPADVRHELEAMIVERGFGDYRGLAAWLRGRGHEISHAAIHRRGRALEREIETLRLATEEAQALVAGAPDDGIAVADATLRLAQVQIYRLLRASQGGDVREAAAAIRALADSIRASISLQKHRRDILREAAEAVDKRLAAAEREIGGSADPAARIKRVREEIYGIFDQ